MPPLYKLRCFYYEQELQKAIMAYNGVFGDWKEGRLGMIIAAEMRKIVNIFNLCN